KKLLARFGSLSGVLNAEPEALRQVKGLSDASLGALKIAALAARRMTRSEVIQKPVLGSGQALIDYLAIDMAHLTLERVRVLYLDSRNRLVRDHLASEGTIEDRKSTRLNSSHVKNSYAVFCLKKKKKI